MRLAQAAACLQVLEAMLCYATLRHATPRYARLVQVLEVDQARAVRADALHDRARVEALARTDRVLELGAAACKVKAARGEERREERTLNRGSSHVTGRGGAVSHRGKV